MKTLVAILSVLILATGIHAQEAPITLEVLGKEYTLVPYQMSQTNLTFEDVRSFLPEDIAKPVGDPENFDATLSRIKNMRRSAGTTYQLEIEELAKKSGIPDLEKAKLEVAAPFHVNQGGELSARCQFYHNRYLALLYLEDMLAASHKNK